MAQNYKPSLMAFEHASPNSKIEKLGFKPKVGLDDGISELIKGISTLHTKNFTNTRN